MATDATVRMNVSISEHDMANLLLRACNAEWEAREAIDWQEAEDLIKTIRTIPPKLRAEIPDLEPIIYLSHVEEWDSGMVAQWPDQIIKAIDAFYRQPVPM